MRSPGAVRRFDGEREGITPPLPVSRGTVGEFHIWPVSNGWCGHRRDDHGSCDGINRRWLRGRISGAIRYILLGSLSLVSIGVGLRAPRRVKRRRAPSMLRRRSRPALRCFQGRRQMECSPWSFHRGPPRTSDLADGDIRCPTSSS